MGAVGRVDLSVLMLIVVAGFRWGIAAGALTLAAVLAGQVTARLGERHYRRGGVR